MELGVALRVMGDQSDPATLLHCAQTAEAEGCESIWVVDHIAIPPDDAEGSNGRYLDPLTTLTWLAGQTARVRIGTSVLILPYRPPLPTAKVIATLQELSGHRLLLGAGVGWMHPEFRALGVPREERGRRTDAMLEFLHQCFGHDEVKANGQPFLFRPRPPRPPILVGGRGPHALRRVVAFGDSWLPMPAPIEELTAERDELYRLADAAGREHPGITLLTGLRGDPDRDREKLRAYRDLGCERVIATTKYADAAGFRDWLQAVQAAHASL